MSDWPAEIYQQYIVVLLERDQAIEEAEQARAELERVKVRYGSFLDWCIGYVEPQKNNGAQAAWGRRFDQRLREERATLGPGTQAGTQEPDPSPAEATEES